MKEFLINLALTIVLVGSLILGYMAVYYNSLEGCRQVLLCEGSR